VSLSAASAPALAGFALGASLIIAIGAQNAFVLRQGLRREHVLVVVSLCAAIDASLITLGVAGLGSLIERVPAVLDLAAVLGAAYLTWQGVRALRSALHPGVLSAAEDAEGLVGTQARPAVVGQTLAVSLLNPHVYLDTVVLVGSIGARYPWPGRAVFALGAMTASFVWFFSLGFGARLLSPLFARPVAWRVLDLLIAGVMFWIAGSLVWGLVGG
jgi:L-lysine exporter family protein LysE/ArgO